MPDLFKEILPKLMYLQDNPDEQHPWAKDSSDWEKEYTPWVINLALSYHYDTIEHANRMNFFWQIPKRMQYDYLKGAIRKYKRRYNPWVKKDSAAAVKTEEIAAIKEYYGYSTQKAIAALLLLKKGPKEELERILNAVDKGGKGR